MARSEPAAMEWDGGGIEGQISRLGEPKVDAGDPPGARQGARGISQ